MDRGYLVCARRGSCETPRHLRYLRRRSLVFFCRLMQKIYDIILHTTAVHSGRSRHLSLSLLFIFILRNLSLPHGHGVHCSHCVNLCVHTTHGAVTLTHDRTRDIVIVIEAVVSCMYGPVGLRSSGSIITQVITARTFYAHARVLRVSACQLALCGLHSLIICSNHTLTSFVPAR